MSERTDREIIASRFADAGLAADRFVNVRDGEKACLDHDTRFDCPDDVPGSNYGIYAEADDRLLILDVDDHDPADEDVDEIGLHAARGLPETLTTESPHGGEHLIFALEDDLPATVFQDELGPANPVPSWGEVQVANKYVVGAGSQLDGCAKDWCDGCADSSGGWYRVKKDREIATISAAEIVRVLTADADLDRTATEPELVSDESDDRTTYDEWLDEERVETALSHIDADVAYPTWRNIGYALVSQFPKSTAKRLFTGWSRTGTKWDEDAERQAHRIIDEASSSGPVTIATLVHLAKRGGWDPAPSKELVNEEIKADAAREAWDAWEQLRTDGQLDASDYIPELALLHIARERGLYDVDALPTTIDELPAKAHNRALHWVQNSWADEHLPGDQEATARPFKSKASVVYTWEDVRYIYAESKDQGRFAAVQLLRQHHHFLTPEDTQELLIYNEDLGIYEPGGSFEATDAGYRTTETGRYNLGRLLDRELGQYYSQHEKTEIEGRLAEHVVDRDDLEAGHRPERLVCVANGVLDLETRELHSHDPDLHFTRRLPVAFDPEASCTPIEAFLDQITRSEEDKHTLLEVLGNAFVDHYQHPFVLVLFGEGSNGKSTWLNVVRELLGRENTTSVTLQQLDENRFATARLVGKWANIAEDLPARRLSNTGILKDLSGGGMVPAEKKGKDGFDFENRAKLMFAANRPPVLGERSYAIARRLVPIHLPHRFTENPDDEHFDKDPTILETLTTDTELSGLLNAALDGLDRLEEHGDVSLALDKMERLELYERHSDHIKAFRIDCLENDGGSRVDKSTVYNAYTNYCTGQGHEPVKRSVFFQQLRRTTLDVAEIRPRTGDGDRTRMLNNVAFTAEGEAYLPGTDREPVPEADETADAEPEEATIPSITELGPSPSATIEAEVVSLLDPRPWLQAEGSLRDESGTINFTARGEANPAAGLEQGGRYRFEHVVVHSNQDGLLEIELRDGLTEITPLTASGHQSGLTAHGAATDGGTEQAPPTPEASDVPADATGTRANIDRVKEVLRRRGTDLPRHKLIVILSAEEGVMGPTDAKHAIEQGLDRGELYSPPGEEDLIGLGG